jgi:hypothetical protein
LKNENIFDTMVFEHQFWLQIMGDHARFIFYSLAPTEEEAILMAKQFMDVYDMLLDKVRGDIKPSDLDEVTEQAFEVTYEFRQFKLQLLTLSLTVGLEVHLPPSFFNHMLNELDEYMLILSNLEDGKIPVFHPLHYHLKWLNDAVGHAASVHSNLDEVEKDFIQGGIVFEKEFTDLYMKAVQLSGYLRTELTNFPALERFNEQAQAVILPFMDLLTDVRDLRLDGKLLGTLLPLMADHMEREECYYMTKLYQVTESNKIDCDPTRPRIEA